MVDFGNTLFDTKLGSEVPLVNPVRDQSGEMFASGLKSGIDGATSFLQADAKNKGAAAQGALYQDITEKVSLLADARDQGTLSLAQANRQLRVWSNEWVSELPGDADSIFTFINKLTQDHGIGGSIYTETPQETGNRKMIEEGASKGWDMSTPEGVSNYQAFLGNTIQLERMAQEYTALETSNKIVSESFKAKFVNQFQTVASTAFPWVQSKIETAYSALQGVSDPTQRQAIIDQVKAEIATQTGLLSSLGSNAGAQSLDYLITPINKLVEQFEQTSSGKSTQQALDTAVARTKAQMELLMFSDPKWGPLFMMNEAMPFTDPAGLAKLDQARLEMFAKMGTEVTRNPDGSITPTDKVPDVVDKVDNVAINFDNEKSIITNALSSEGVTPEQTQAVSDRIAVTLHSVTRNGAAETDATNFTGVVNYLADTSVGQWLEQNYNEIGPKIASDAAVVVERQYSDVVLDLVNERWLDAGTEIAKAIPELTSENFDVVGSSASAETGIEKVEIDKVIEPVWNGYGLEFKVKDEYKKFAKLQGIARELNQGKNSVAGPINKLVRMTAHLAGSTDYEKVYNENFKGRLWVTGEDAPGMENVDKNETLDSTTNIPDTALDYTRPPAPKGFKVDPSTRPGQVGQLLDAIGEAEGAGYDTLFGYAEQPGGDFAGTQLTNMTISEVQNLQKRMVAANGISSAVGKYQFIQDTLAQAVQALGLSPDTAFTPEVQDRLALWLLQNRTSFNDWILGAGDPASFQNELASQWASVPNTTGRSTYASDGVNNASAAGAKLVGML